MSDKVDTIDSNNNNHSTDNEPLLDQTYTVTKEDLEDIISNTRAKEEEKRERLFQEVGKVLVEGKTLDEDQKEFLESLSSDARSSLMSQVNEIKDMQTVSKFEFDEQKSAFTNSEDFKRFHHESEKILSNGGKKVIQITDSHLPIEDLEHKLIKTIKEQGFDPSRDVIVHTGDIIPDLISLNGRPEMYRPSRIVEEGFLSKEESEDFLNAYSTLIEFSGLDPEILESGKITDENAAESLKKFKAYLLGIAEPSNLSDQDSTKFKDAQNRVMGHVKSAILNHANHNYTKLKEVLERNGLNPDNFISIPGNHDVPEEMKKVIGDYMIHPGQIKEVNGVNFGNYLAGSNGSVLGPYMSDEYGVLDSDRIAALRHKTDSFQSLLEAAEEHGVALDERKLDRLYDMAKRREGAFGIKKEEGLTDYFHRRINPELDHTVDRLKKDVPHIDLSNVDILLNHGMITHEEHAGEEEKEVHKRLKENNYSGVVLHGHEHDNTTHKKDGVFYVNPGEFTSNNSNTILLDDENKFHKGLFRNLNQNSGNLEFRLYHPSFYGDTDGGYKIENR